MAIVDYEVYDAGGSYGIKVVFSSGRVMRFVGFSSESQAVAYLEECREIAFMV